MKFAKSKQEKYIVQYKPSEFNGVKSERKRERTKSDEVKARKAFSPSPPLLPFPLLFPLNRVKFSCFLLYVMR